MFTQTVVKDDIYLKKEELIYYIKIRVCMHVLNELSSNEVLIQTGEANFSQNFALNIFGNFRLPQQPEFFFTQPFNNSAQIL